jgi:hypothetical protein
MPDAREVAQIFACLPLPNHQMVVLRQCAAKRSSLATKTLGIGREKCVHQRLSLSQSC